MNSFRADRARGHLAPGRAAFIHQSDQICLPIRIAKPHGPVRPKMRRCFTGSRNAFRWSPPLQQRNPYFGRFAARFRSEHYFSFGVVAANIELERRETSNHVLTCVGPVNSPVAVLIMASQPK